MGLDSPEMASYVVGLTESEAHQYFETLLPVGAATEAFMRELSNRMQRGLSTPSLNPPGAVSTRVAECSCYAMVHGLFTNCTACGKVLCRAEAGVMCAACGASPLRLGNGAPVTPATVIAVQQALSAADSSATAASIANLTTSGAPRRAGTARRAATTSNPTVAPETAPPVAPETAPPSSDGTSQRGDATAEAAFRRQRGTGVSSAVLTVPPAASASTIAFSASAPIFQPTRADPSRAYVSQATTVSASSGDVTKKKAGRGNVRVELKNGRDIAAPAGTSAVEVTSSAEASAAIAEKSLAVAEAHKARLLAADRASGLHTRVLDDGEDYFSNSSSAWLSPDERAIASTAAAARSKALSTKKRELTLTLDLQDIGRATGARMSDGGVKVIDEDATHEQAVMNALHASITTQGSTHVRSASVPHLSDAAVHGRQGSTALKSDGTQSGDVTGGGGAGTYVNHTLSGRAAEVYAYIRAEAAAARRAAPVLLAARSNDSGGSTMLSRHVARTLQHDGDGALW